MTNGVPGVAPRPWTLVILLLAVSVQSAEGSAPGAYGHYINQFAVKVKSGLRTTAEEVARHHGFVVKRELPNINVFLLEHPTVHHRSKRSAVDHLQVLRQDTRVELAEQEVELRRDKRRVVHDKQLEFPIRTVEDDSVYKRFEPATLAVRDGVFRAMVDYKDPKFKDMWYLVNTGQSGGEHGMDMNIGVVWASGFTGRGVVVTILDDGIDHTHPDLAQNYDPKASADLNDKSDRKDDPMPDVTDPNNSHGTRCAGEVAAIANNNICGVGVAYNARIGGVRILDGRITDSLEAEALNVNLQYIDIYSASWGPTDNGQTMEGPRKFSLEAFHRATRKGRGGLGSIFVWATGNGGHYHDCCSADGYVSLPETLSVGSVNDMGRSPFFMEFCSSTMTVVPSGGSDYVGQEKKEGIKLKVVTTDINGGCIENFQGTSSAAPLAAGCIANVLQANPSLSWRDVQHLVVLASRVPSADNTWTINGAGHHVSPKFGFGLLDCGKMVELAQTWDNVPEQRICNTTRKNYQILKKNGTITDSLHTSGCHDDDSRSLDRLEHVQVYVKMFTEVRGQTKFVLTSPADTRSVLLSPRINDKYSGDWEFTFMTVHSWGESPHGTWTLEIHHVPAPHNKTDNKPDHKVKEDDDEDDHVKTTFTPDTVGYIKQWSLVLCGSHGARHGRTHVGADRKQRASYPTEEEVRRIKKDELEVSRRVHVKRAEVASRKRENIGVRGRGDMDVLIRRLWTELHAHGAKSVRKRVLGDTGKGGSDKRGQGNVASEKRGQTLHDLVGEFIVALKRALNGEGSLK